MSKKSRRARAKHHANGKPVKKVPVKRIEPTVATGKSDTVMPSIASARSSTQMIRYQYVVPELRRIGIISGALLLILVILTFVLG